VQRLLAVHRRAGIVQDTELRYDPGLAAHHAAKGGVLRCIRGTEPCVRRLVPEQIARRHKMLDTSKIREHMDVISSDRKTVGQVDHLEGSDKIKLTKQSSPAGQHHHFIPVSWVDHVDQHVHLNKSGADITAHWQHGQS
jgi:hypothetical protein